MLLIPPSQPSPSGIWQKQCVFFFCLFLKGREGMSLFLFPSFFLLQRDALPGKMFTETESENLLLLLFVLQWLETPTMRTQLNLRLSKTVIKFMRRSLLFDQNEIRMSIKEQTTNLDPFKSLICYFHADFFFFWTNSVTALWKRCPLPFSLVEFSCWAWYSVSTPEW